MNVITTKEFEKNWKSWVYERKDSHMTVLLCCSTVSLEKTWQKRFLTELRLHCQVERVMWQEDENLTEWLRQIRTDYLLVFGNLRMLQEICRGRREGTFETEEQGNRPSVIYLSTEILWEHMIKRELLWIRDRDGVTLYLGRTGWQDGDLVVMPDMYGTEQKRVFTALSRHVAKLEEYVSGDHAARKDSRYLWEELAEPLWLRYGMPIWMGILLAVRYMGNLKETKTAKKLEQILAERKDRPEEKLWIPAEDVELLVDMAMAGIEMLPQQERLSWQQIKEFYMKLSRSV